MPSKPKTMTKEEQLEKLAQDIYESAYKDLTPLQQQELEQHLAATNKLNELTRKDRIGILFDGVLELNARIETEKHT